MRFVLQPWQLFFLILAGWINREQQEIIEFQNAQIRVLMEKMGRIHADDRGAVRDDVYSRSAGNFLFM